MARNIASDEELADVLRQLLVPNTDAIRDAQNILKGFVKQPGAIVRLLTQIQSHNDPVVRQLAAMVLKQRINIHMVRFSSEEQEHIKAALLQALVGDPVKVVRSAVANTIAQLAKSIAANNQGWPQLPNMIASLAQDANPDARELAFTLLERIAESAYGFVQAELTGVTQIVLQGLHDDHLNARAAAIKSANALFLNSNEEGTEILQPCAVPIIQSLPGLVEDYPDVAVEALDVLQECVARAVPVLNDQLHVLVPMLIQYQVAQPDIALKQSANNLLLAIAEFRPKLLAKKGLVTGIIEACFQMIASNGSATAAGALFNMSAEGTELDEEEEEQDEAFVAQQLAQVMLDQLAVRVPSKYVFPTCAALCAQCLQSPEPSMRRTGAAVLGVISEGCQVQIKENLPQILPALINLIHEEDQGIRECVGFCFGQFAEYCQPEFLWHHQEVIPAIGQLLGDSRISVQAVACYAMEQFLENLQPETVAPYSEAIMNRLLQLSHSPSVSVRERVLGGMASVAISIEDAFEPYLAPTCEMLEELLFLSDFKMFRLRGRALELLGHASLAVGKDAFRPYCELGMRSCVQAAQIDDQDLQEFSHVYISNVAKVMQEEFAPYVPEVVEYLKGVISTSELSTAVDMEDDTFTGINEADEMDDEADYAYLDIRPTFVNFKRSAFASLGAIAKYTGEHFLPFLEDSLNLLYSQQKSVHQAIRAEVMTVFPELLACATAVFGPKSVAPGEVVQVASVVQQIIQKMIPLMLEVISKDVDRTPVAHAIGAIEEILKLVGRAALTGFQDAIMNLVLQVLQEQTTCQLLIAEDDVEVDEEDEDHDNIVMDSAHDLMGQLAKALGSEFTPYFDQFLPLSMKFFRPNRPWVDRAMAIGCIGEVTEAIGPASFKYAEVVLPALQACLQDEMASVRRNAAYATGAFCLAVGEQLASEYLTILHWLHPLCERKDQGTDTSAADTDNALAAVSRMIVACPQAVPLNAVLPVFFNNLPLTSDLVEYSAIFQCISLLLENNSPEILTHFNDVLNLIGHVLHPTSTTVEPEVKIAVVHLLRRLNETHAQLLQDAFAQASEDTRQIVVAAMEG